MYTYIYIYPHNIPHLCRNKMSVYCALPIQGRWSTLFTGFLVVRDPFYSLNPSLLVKTVKKKETR